MSLLQTDQRKITRIFRGVRHTLLNRGLCQHLGDGTVREVPWARAIFLPSLRVVGFQVDTLRLPVKIEKLLDPGVAHQMKAALGGCEVKVTNTHGLIVGVRLEPEEIRAKVRLPRQVPLSLDGRPDGDFMIPLGIGQDGPRWQSLLKTGHILVGGRTQSGKSSWINSVLVSLLTTYNPTGFKLAIVDPKEVEFARYGAVPHLLAPVALDVDDAERLTTQLLYELDRRRLLFTPYMARNLASYNERAEAPLPLILLVVDEVTDIALLAGLKSPFYTNLIRLVSKGLAFGLVVILATQNPKAEVMNTLIRANIATRIAFAVQNAQHGRNIGVPGAYLLPGATPGRMMLQGRKAAGAVLQAYWVDDATIAAVVTGTDGEPVVSLPDLHREMVLFAVEELGGAFPIATLYERFGQQISKRQIEKLAQKWELAGWLTRSNARNLPRMVSQRLAVLAGVSSATPETPVTL